MDYIKSYVDSQPGEIPPHMQRFLLHLVLLIRTSLKQDDGVDFDDLICMCLEEPLLQSSKISLSTVLGKFTDNLVSVKLHSLVPYYLFHLSPVCSEEKIITFLQGRSRNVVLFLYSLHFSYRLGIEQEAEQKEVLAAAVEAGLDVAGLCRSVYGKIKEECKIDKDAQVVNGRVIWNELEGVRK